MSKTTNGAGGFAPREVGSEGGTPKGQHTPGPWTVGNELNSERPGSVPVVALVRDSLGGRMHVAFVNGKAGEQEANAALIAAAPDLLDFVRRVVDDAGATVRKGANGMPELCGGLDPAILLDEFLRHGRKAIARATGGAR